MKIIEDVNKEIYGNLERILQKLDDKLDLKLYAVMSKGNEEWEESGRVKSVLSDEPGRETEPMQELLSGPGEVLEKLGLDIGDGDVNDFLSNLSASSFKSGLFRPEYESNSGVAEDQAAAEIDETAPPVRSSADRNLLYTRLFKLEADGKAYKVRYILAVEYADPVARHLFIARPQLSFLRMVLDYYFSDYYKFLNDTELLVEPDGEIETKYKENDVQFLQRMARLFFGKIQNFIVNEIDLREASGADVDLTETERNQYYINNLLEKIDGISTRTYERESPFGCMLLMKTSLLKDSKLINYAIRFQNHQPIYLEDARRIRKLLELTNNEQDLYLMADDKEIYGIGEIDWSRLQENLVFKVEFKGLSRYDLLLVTTEKKDDTDARVVTENESKTFKMTVNLEIVSRKLTGISFKQPAIGAGGFEPDLFKRTMEAQFLKAEPPVTVTDQALEKLRLVIQKATEQQHGTMVVITDPITAEKELLKLRKQSTPIMPTAINPAFIKHLTSIDGAIYFDTTGACHAIGVILDGLAQDHHGDSSRGARFHSAYRYLEKLKNDRKGCVIAIVSEDGMVNLIPEQVNEAIVRKLVREMITYIKDNEPLSDEEIRNYERRLEEAAGETEIDHHHYFKVADTFFTRKKFLKAARFYQKGLDEYGQFNLDYNRALALSYLKQGLEIDDEKRPQSYKDAVEQYNLIEKVSSSELNHEDYNRRGIAYYQLGIQANKKTQSSYFNKSKDDYTRSIELKKRGKKYILYRNRGYLFNVMNKQKEALDDFICSETEQSDEITLSSIKELVEEDVQLFLYALNRYSENKNDKHDSENLRKLLAECGSEWAAENSEVAAALERQGMEGLQPESE